MKAPDLDKERSEKPHTLAEFLKLYNENLPLSFPRVSAVQLAEFRSTHLGFFKPYDVWSLDLHRKKVMDWLQLITIQKAG